MSDRISYDKIRSAARRAFREEKKRNLLLGEIEGWAEHSGSGGGMSRTGCIRISSQSFWSI